MSSGIPNEEKLFAQNSTFKQRKDVRCHLKIFLTKQMCETPNKTTASLHDIIMTSYILLAVEITC